MSVIIPHSTGSGAALAPEMDAFPPGEKDDARGWLGAGGAGPCFTDLGSSAERRTRPLPWHVPSADFRAVREAVFVNCV